MAEVPGEGAARRGREGLLGLPGRLLWLMRLRWLAAAGVVAFSVGAVQLLGVELPLFSLTLCGLIIAIYNVAFYLWFERETREGELSSRAASLMANVQIAVDLAMLTLVLHLSGGVENPLACYYVFHVIIASTLLSPLAAFLQASWAAALYAGMVLAEQVGWLPHFHLPYLADARLYLTPWAWAKVAAIASMLYVAAYLAVAVAAVLRRREEQLQQVGQEARVLAARSQLAYERLLETQRAQIQYMRRITHELKAPMAAIATALRVVLEGMAGEVPEKQREMIERALRRAEEGLVLLEDLLALARVRELPEQEFEPVEIAHVVEAVVERYRDQAEAKGLEFETEISGRLPPVLGDPEALSSLLSNLVSNAIKYTDPGGRVKIAAREDDGWVVIEVSDTGRGIAEEDLPRIFEEFYRSPDVRRAGVEGTGLGLAIVKSIADRHGGVVDVKSKFGEGTTFIVRLPGMAQV